MFEATVAQGSARLREAGIIGEGVEVFMPDVPVIERESAPLPPTARYFTFIYLAAIVLLGLAALGAIVFAVYLAFGVPEVADSWLITKLFGFGVMLFGIIIASGAAIGVIFVLAAFVSVFLKGGVRRQFVDVVQNVYGASPQQYLERGWLVDSFEFYGLDTTAGKYFDYSLKTGWTVRAVPLSMVQRFEHLRNTETTVTHEISSTNRVRSNSTTRSEHSLRMHVIDNDGQPLQIVVPFGPDEARLQNWITALNAALT
jgi:hypothetical protein